MDNFTHLMMQRQNGFSNKFTLSSICGEKMMWTVFPSVMLNTPESFGTCLLIDSVKQKGILHYEIYIYTQQNFC